MSRGKCSRQEEVFYTSAVGTNRLWDWDRKLRIINSSSPLQQVLFIITPQRLIKSAVFSSRCSAVVSEPLNSKVVKCMRHLIRLKCNPLSGKQLIWLIILLYLRTLRGFKILDLNTQTGWGRCAPDFVCLVGAEKYFTLDPSPGFLPNLVLCWRVGRKKSRTNKWTMSNRCNLWCSDAYFLLKLIYCDCRWNTFALFCFMLVFNNDQP